MQMMVGMSEVDRQQAAALETVSESLENSSEGFSYSRMYDNPTEVFPLWFKACLNISRMQVWCQYVPVLNSNK